MRSFNYYSPTKIYFGEGQIRNLKREARKYGGKVLFVYGGGSIKRNGVYDQVIRALEGMEVVELNGILPNPRIDKVREGVDLCREHDIDMIVAVGGGSTMDSSKAIAAGVKYKKDPWDLVIGKAPILDALPILAVVTINATGSETNPFGVISNLETKEKLGFTSEYVIPKAAFLDPSVLFSLPPIQTAAGSADTMSHIFEVYFHEENAPIQDGLSEAILRTVIQYTPIALKEPSDLEARSNLMWASTMALNNMTAVGKTGAWSCHAMEHELSAFYDVTHGVGLAILTPQWMRYVLDKDSLARFVRYGVFVWGIDKNKDEMEIAKEAIDKTEEFFKSIGIPMQLGELGIGSDHIHEMAKLAYEHGNYPRAYRALTVDDIEKIYRACL